MSIPVMEVISGIGVISGMGSVISGMGVISGIVICGMGSVIYISGMGGHSRYSHLTGWFITCICDKSNGNLCDKFITRRCNAMGRSPHGKKRLCDITNLRKKKCVMFVCNA